MKKFFLAGIVAALSSTAFAADVVEPIFAEPAVAGPRVSGYLDAYIGGLNIPDADDTFFTFGGSGKLNAPLNERWNIQGDLLVDSTEIEDFDMTTFGGAVHAFWRDPSSYAFGVFGTYSGHNIAIDTGGGSGDITFNEYTFGPEAQAYFGNLTLYGQAYFGQLDLGAFAPIDNMDIWGARAVARYFVQPNLRFDGELGFETFEIEDESLDIFSAAVQAMYRFEASPVSVFARYQFENWSTSDGPDIDVDTHKFMVGLRASFGSETLIEEDRNGATMDTRRRNIGFPLFVGL